jgi:hypothetical protein
VLNLLRRNGYNYTKIHCCFCRLDWQGRSKDARTTPIEVRRPVQLPPTGGLRRGAGTGPGRVISCHSSWWWNQQL